MRKPNRQLRFIANSLAPPTRVSDTSGNPSESYHWRHMAAVRREWIHEFWLPRAYVPELTLSEIVNIETRVRKELYP